MRFSAKAVWRSGRDPDPFERAKKTAEESAKTLDHLIQRALLCQASDLHLYPLHGHIAVEARVAGELFSWGTLPGEFLVPLVTRIRAMANLDLMERKRPQEGWIRFPEPATAETRSARVSLIPCASGTSAAFRFHWPNRPDSLGSLGMEQFIREPYLQLLRKPGSMVLISGQAGSGKTTTFYTTLRELRSAGAVVASIEDPPEDEVPGILQIPAAAGAAETATGFLDAARAALRHDVDVVGIGEIRDPPTARAAVWARLSGKVALATIHARDAVETIYRLSELGVPLETVAAVLDGVLYQELVRTLGPDCSPNISPLESAHRHGHPSGGNSGYAGRIGIFELLTPGPQSRMALSRGVPEPLFRQLVGDEGDLLLTIERSLLAKVEGGIVSPDEAQRCLRNKERPIIPAAKDVLGISREPVAAHLAPACRRERISDANL